MVTISEPSVKVLGQGHIEVFGMVSGEAAETATSRSKMIKFKFILVKREFEVNIN